MVYDPVRECLYLLGRFIEPTPQPESPDWNKSDFWMYETSGPQRGKWRLLSRDTEVRSNIFRERVACSNFCSIAGWRATFDLRP